MRGMTGDFAGQQIAHDDAGSTTVDDDDVNQFGAIEQSHTTQTNLARQLLICAEQQLLASLTARIERAAHLRTAERPIVKQTAIFARERHALRHHLVDDVHRNLSQAIHIGFTRAEVAALDRVGEQAVHAVAVAPIVLRRIDAALCRNRVRTTWRVVERERINLIAEFGKGRRRRRPSQSCTDDDDLELALVVWVH